MHNHVQLLYGSPVGTPASGHSYGSHSQDTFAEIYPQFAPYSCRAISLAPLVNFYPQTPAPCQGVHGCFKAPGQTGREV